MPEDELELGVDELVPPAVPLVEPDGVVAELPEPGVVVVALPVPEAPEASEPDVPADVPPVVPLVPVLPLVAAEPPLVPAAP